MPPDVFPDVSSRIHVALHNIYSQIHGGVKQSIHRDQTFRQRWHCVAAEQNIVCLAKNGKVSYNALPWELRDLGVIPSPTPSHFCKGTSTRTG